jgi:hypothetical protein
MTNRPQYEQIKIPKLDPYVKRLNGKSSRQVDACLDELHATLEDKPQDEKDSTGAAPVAE